jgi:C-terminal processing protease CtpA/Prc
MARWLVIFGCAMLPFLGCTAGEDQSAGPDPTRAHLPDGIWEVAGYGLLVEVDDGARTVWYVTASTCVEGDDDFEIDGLTTVGSGYEATQAGVVTEYHLVPVELPASCDDPGSGLDVSLIALDETFTTYYPFLDERRFDWDGAMGELAADVGSDDDPEVFESALAGLTTELGDGHTFLEHQDDTGARANTFRHRLGGSDEADAAIDAEVEATRQRLDPDSVRFAANDKVVWGELTSDVGYLAIDSFDELDGDIDDGAADLAALAQALDRAFADLGDLPHLLIDVRFNEGGFDGTAVLAAGYLVEAPTPAYVQYAFAAPDRTRRTTEITPAADRPYDGEVTLLTSPLTASAAEVFLLAVTGTTDATIVGEPSAGEFSDIVDRVFPNGVELAMSMEVYTTLDGTNHEAQGVPVDVAASFDTSIDTALAMIESTS